MVGLARMRGHGCACGQIGSGCGARCEGSVYRISCSSLWVRSASGHYGQKCCPWGHQQGRPENKSSSKARGCQQSASGSFKGCCHQHGQKQESTAGHGTGFDGLTTRILEDFKLLPINALRNV